MDGSGTTSRFTGRRQTASDGYLGDMSLEDEAALAACLPEGESLPTPGSMQLERILKEQLALRNSLAPLQDQNAGSEGQSGEPSTSVSRAGPSGPATPAAIHHPSTTISINPAFDSSTIFPQFQNIVATVDLVSKLDLQKIALQARNAEYNPKRFSAVIMRIRDPRTTALVFASGKMVCTGARSEESSRLAARKFARIIQKLGFEEVRFRNFRIQNMVATVDVKFPVRLESLVLSHAQFCTFEPELFPGVVYRMIKPRVCLLIFVSGKVVLTGAKLRSDIYNAIESIYPILRSFRKQ